MRKMKHDIWAGYNNSYHRTNNNHNDKDNKRTALPRYISSLSLLPIIIPYSKIAIHLVREWRNDIANYPYFANRRIVAAYTKHRNLHQILGNKR